MKKKLKVKTRFGTDLTDHQIKAYKTILKLIEHEENFSKNHTMADIFRSYFDDGSN